MCPGQNTKMHDPCSQGIHPYIQLISTPRFLSVIVFHNKNPLFTCPLDLIKNERSQRGILEKQEIFGDYSATCMVFYFASGVSEMRQHKSQGSHGIYRISIGCCIEKLIMGIKGTFRKLLEESR